MNEFGQIVVSDSGKVEIHELICEEPGLLPGARFIVESDNQCGIRRQHPSEEESGEKLKSSLAEPQLIWKNGALMVRAEPIGELEQAVERDREARVEKFIAAPGTAVD